VLSAHWVLSAVLSVDFLLILSVPVRLSATSLSEVALKVWASPCTLSAIVGPASQTELSACAALALCVLWVPTLTSVIWLSFVHWPAPCGNVAMWPRVRRASRTALFDLDKLAADSHAAFNDYSSETLEETWAYKTIITDSIIESKGGNDYDRRRTTEERESAERGPEGSRYSWCGRYSSSCDPKINIFVTTVDSGIHGYSIHMKDSAHKSL